MIAPAVQSDRYTEVPMLFPSGLLTGERFYVWASPVDETATTVRSLLAWASPGAVCVGTGQTPPADATVVVCQPDALAICRHLMAVSVVRPEALRFMPIPEGYPWAFWETWAMFADRPDLWRCLAAFEAYRHFCVRSPYLGGASASAATNWSSLRKTSWYWAEAAPQFSSHRDALHHVRDGLADELSRTTFDMVLASDPRTLWHHYLSVVFATTDYLDVDTPRLGDQVLNLGVFTGHEIPYFSALVGPTGSVHSIDPVGFDLLSDYCRRYVRASHAPVMEARFAASASIGEARFRSYGDGQLCHHPDGASDFPTFSTRTVDDYVESTGLSSVDFVKIDVEGMELEALAGMESTVRRFRPTISVAIYHQPDHLWRIPRHLMTVLTGYRFHVSHTSPVRWETVLTAVPEERQARSASGAIRPVSRTHSRVVKLS